MFCLVAEENGFPLPEALCDMPPPPAPDGLDLPTPPPPPGDENYDGTKMPKSKHMFVQTWYLFSLWCFVSFFSLNDYMFAFCYSQPYLFILALLLLVSVNFYTLCSYFHTCLSLLTQLCILAGHECDVILLALALSLWGSAWAPALARCTHARFFCPLLNHVRPRSFLRPDSLQFIGSSSFWCQKYWYDIAKTYLHSGISKAI